MPNSGRYLESDPIGISGGPNSFMFVNANPLRFVDPKGLYSPLAYSDPGQSSGSVASYIEPVSQPLNSESTGAQCSNQQQNLNQPPTINQIADAVGLIGDIPGLDVGFLPLNLNLLSYGLQPTEENASEVRFGIIELIYPPLIPVDILFRSNSAQ